jgi:predicted Fe-Mo cluster-binding NifX family protein
MKIAAVTDDGITISQHFGRASKYAVITVEEGKIVNRELRDKVGHHEFSREEQNRGHEHHNDPRGRGFGRHSADKHKRMFANIMDCEVVLARGMGRGAYQGLQQSNLKPILTDIADIESAVQAVIEGTIIDHLESLH